MDGDDDDIPGHTTLERVRDREMNKEMCNLRNARTSVVINYIWFFNSFQAHTVIAIIPNVFVHNIIKGTVMARYSNKI